MITVTVTPDAPAQLAERGCIAYPFRDEEALYRHACKRGTWRGTSRAIPRTFAPYLIARIWSGRLNAELRDFTGAELYAAGWPAVREIVAYTQVEPKP